MQAVVFKTFHKALKQKFKIVELFSFYSFRYLYPKTYKLLL